MQRKFFTNLALLLLLNLLIKPVWILGIDREVQNILGNESYGLYFALFNLSFLLNALLDLGITNFNNRNIARHSQLLTKHFSNIVGLKIALGILFTIITMLAGITLGYSAYSLYLLGVLCFNQFLISFIQYLRSNISGLHLFRTDSLVSVLDRLFMIILTALILYTGFAKTFSIEIFIYLQTAGYGLTALVGFWIVYREAGHFRMRWNRPFFFSILKKSIPFAILIILMMFYNRADTIIIERILPDGAEQSGIYAQAYRLLDAVNMIGVIFAGLLLPMFSRMLKTREEVNKLLNLSLSLILSVAMITAVGSWAYKTELMDLLYDENIAQSSDVYGLLMFSFIGISITHIFGTLLTANGSLRIMNQIALGGAILSLSLNLILVPELKAFGAAVTANVVQLGVALALMITTGRVFKFEVKYYLIFRSILFFTGLVLGAWVLNMVEINWMTGFIFFVVWGMIWAFITKMLSPRSLYFLVKDGD